MNWLIENLEELAGADIVLARSEPWPGKSTAEQRPTRANPGFRAMLAWLARKVGRNSASPAPRCRP